MATDLTQHKPPATVDLSGLPEADVQLVRQFVQGLRDKNAEGATPDAGGGEPNPVVLPKWEGTVHGTLTRDEIYDDVG